MDLAALNTKVLKSDAFITEADIAAQQQVVDHMHTQSQLPTPHTPHIPLAPPPAPPQQPALQVVPRQIVIPPVISQVLSQPMHVVQQHEKSMLKMLGLDTPEVATGTDFPSRVVLFLKRQDSLFPTILKSILIPGLEQAVVKILQSMYFEFQAGLFTSAFDGVTARLATNVGEGLLRSIQNQVEDTLGGTPVPDPPHTIGSVTEQLVQEIKLMLHPEDPRNVNLLTVVKVQQQLQFADIKQHEAFMDQYLELVRRSVAQLLTHCRTFTAAFKTHLSKIKATMQSHSQFLKCKADLQPKLERYPPDDTYLQTIERLVAVPDMASNVIIRPPNLAALGPDLLCQYVTLKSATELPCTQIDCGLPMLFGEVATLFHRQFVWLHRISERVVMQFHQGLGQLNSRRMGTLTSLRRSRAVFDRKLQMYARTPRLPTLLGQLYALEMFGSVLKQQTRLAEIFQTLSYEADLKFLRA